MVSVSMDYSEETGKIGWIYIPPHLKKIHIYKFEIKLRIKLIGEENKIHAERTMQSC